MTKVDDEKPIKRVLIAIHHSAFSNVLNEIICVLKKSGQYEPIVLLANENTLRSMSLESLHEENISCFDPAGKLIAPFNRQTLEKSDKFSHENKSLTWWQSTKKIIHNQLKPVLQRVKKVRQEILPIYDIVFHLWQLTKLAKIVRRLIQKLEISVLVIGAETQFFSSPASVKAARTEHIPVLNAAMFFAPDGGEIPESLMSWSAYGMQRWINRMAGSFYPHWVGELRGNSFLYLPGEEAIAQEWLNMADPQPPVGVSNYSDAILIECEKIKEYAISDGLPPEKLIVTGEVIHDVMAETLSNADHLRESFYEKLGLPMGKPMLLSGLAPDRISGREARLPNWEFSSYAEMVRFWVQSLAAVSETYNIIITLHPSQRYEDLSYIEQWGVKIASEKTSSLIPLCAIYVTDGVSSTIPWAIACGKPVIEYDTFCWRLSTYADAGGVLRVEQRDDFLSSLNRLTNDPEYYTRIAAQQVTVAKHWGKLDGGSRKRILQLFDRLTAKVDFEKT